MGGPQGGAGKTGRGGGQIFFFSLGGGFIVAACTGLMTRVAGAMGLPVSPATRSRSRERRRRVGTGIRRRSLRPLLALIPLIFLSLLETTRCHGGNGVPPNGRLACEPRVWRPATPLRPDHLPMPVTAMFITSPPSLRIRPGGDRAGTASHPDVIMGRCRRRAGPVRTSLSWPWCPSRRRRLSGMGIALQTLVARQRLGPLRARACVVRGDNTAGFTGAGKDHAPRPLGLRVEQTLQGVVQPYCKRHE